MCLLVESIQLGIKSMSCLQSYCRLLVLSETAAVSVLNCNSSAHTTDRSIYQVDTFVFLIVYVLNAIIGRTIQSTLLDYTCRLAIEKKNTYVYIYRAV